MGGGKDDLNPVIPPPHTVNTPTVTLPVDFAEFEFRWTGKRHFEYFFRDFFLLDIICYNYYFFLIEKKND